MVAFTSLFVLATACLSVVSALAIPKRDLGTDSVNIKSALENFDEAIKNLNAADPAGSTAAIQQGISELVGFLESAAVSEQGGSEVSDDSVTVFTSTIKKFKTLISDIKKATKTIISIDGLAGIMQSGLLDCENATKDYIDVVLTLLPPDIQASAQNEELKILNTFQKVRALLSAKQ